jgi:hypothetical protein
MLVVRAPTATRMALSIGWMFLFIAVLLSKPSRY